MEKDSINFTIAMTWENDVRTPTLACTGYRFAPWVDYLTCRWEDEYSVKHVAPFAKSVAALRLKYRSAILIKI